MGDHAEMVREHTTARATMLAARAVYVRAQRKERYWRLLLAGSCIVCGAEKYKSWSRCRDCARKNASATAVRRAASRG